ALVPVLKAMADVGYFPKYITSPAIYEERLVKEAGAELDQTIVLPETKLVPFELADTHPSTKQFVELMRKQGGLLKSLSVNSFTAWLLFAKAAGECGSELTRACVLEKATAVKDWTGGGLHRPSEPGPTSGPPSQCSAILRATSKGFSVATDIYTPNTDGIFKCDPKIAMVIPNA
ncbi:MAG TPA: ABC transporter substrate-binding protein, partial [Ilumatobacteraceae bacterium]|nr:ABC transporter substrate-binding protein [Ilumatobacteraceae bacterium]